MARIEFTDNYEDLSTENGFQFRFRCESCGNGYLSSWQPNKVGIAASILRGAGHIVGGVLGRAASGSYEIQRAIGGPQHDRALEAAVEEIRPLFVQCSRCGQWVCEQVCWNAERALCVHCAPVMQRELAARQASIAVEQVEAKLREQDLTEGVDVTSKATVRCPACGEATLPGKFCSACGARLAASVSCPRCGTEMPETARFCPQCGQKMA